MIKNIKKPTKTKKKGKKNIRIIKMTKKRQAKEIKYRQKIEIPAVEININHQVEG